MATYYSNWKADLYTCPACSWKGTGEQCTQGELFSELFEICCPSCGENVGLVMFPTIEESRENWDKVSEEDKRAVETIERLQKDFAARSLKSPDQLPDIEGNDLILTWDLEDYQRGGDTVIKYGGEIIWREPARYECYKRFAEVANILRRKYGDRLHDLAPTDRSLLYLYGDCSFASGEVAEVRRALAK